MNNILFIHPNGSKYKKIEMGIKSELNNRINILSLSSKSETDIINFIHINSPKMVIITNKDMIKIWKKIQQKHQELNQISTVLLESEFFGISTGDMPNNCIISYETKLEQYIDRVTYLTGKKPSNIGIVHSSRTIDLAKSYQKECSLLNINPIVKQVVVSDPENSIKSIVSNLTDHYNIDFMLILDDEVTINNEIINSTWVSLLSKLKMPIAVPAEYFYEIEPRIGSFAIQPHYSAIGSVVAAVINETESNNWTMHHKNVYTDKNIFYFRNKDGSVSKQNQIENKIIASYYPETRTDQSTQKPAEPQEQPKLQHTAPQPKVDLSAAAPQNIEQNSLQQASDLSSSMSSTITERQLKESASQAIASNTITADVDNRSTALKKAITSGKVTKEKKQPQTLHANAADVHEDMVFSDVKEKEQPAVHPKVKRIEEIPVHFVATKNDTYNIKITASNAEIYRDISGNRPILEILSAGDQLLVTSEDSLYYCVSYLETTGFLSKADAIKIKQKDFFSDINWTNILLIIAAIISLIALFFLVRLLFKSIIAKSNNMNRNNCLLITKRKKHIKYSDINNKSISLVTHLKNYGFNIIMSRNLNKTSDLLLFNLPEIICIDWQFDPEIEIKINSILKEQMFAADFILIFYNVDESFNKKMGYFVDRTFYLNSDFTISDFNNFLSIVKAKSNDKMQINDKSNSHLEGKIMEDTLPEIFQMMDLNKKTGCLIVENNHPFGMIFFEDGIITYSITNTQVAEMAVFEILTMKHGRFHFLTGKKPLSRHMELSVVEVLLERAKYIDEVQNPVLSC